jgi:hypothetical protein
MKHIQTLIKQLFCKHSWREHPIPGMDAGTEYFVQKRCSNCGRIEWDKTKVVIRRC